MQIRYLEHLPREACGHGPSLEVEPPAELVEPRTEKRLVSALRDAARTRDPLAILVRATLAEHAGQARLARALADLAATGGAASRGFARRRLLASDLAASASRHLSGRSSDDADLVRAAARIYTRAHLVARFIEGDGLHRAVLAREHPELAEWIAVSGEDDPPHRPVNVPPTAHAQRFCRVRAGDHELSVRYAMSGPAGAPVVLLLHGHSSSAEEHERVMDELSAIEGPDGRPRYCVISPDLPSSGYTSRVDHEEVAPHDPRGAPVLAFLDEFVEAFARTVLSELGVEQRVACVAGGSMGGSLALRLSERGVQWIERFAAWSPASVWSSLTDDLIKGLGLSRTRTMAFESESAATRRAYFREVFATPVCLTGRTQPEMWYRDGLPCRAKHILRVMADRREIYGAEYRRWHWRLAHEQLVFSHVAPARGLPAPFRAIRGPVLLVAGEHDNFMWTHIYSRTRDLAARLARRGVRGECLLLSDTGHSIHDERPAFLARALDAFITRHPV